MYDSVEAHGVGQRGDAMVDLLEEGLRDKEVVIVGATGRTPRGWWGDETVGRVLPEPAIFDPNRPELLPVRVPMRSAAYTSSCIPEVMDVGVPAIKLRLRPSPPPSPAVAAATAEDGAEEGGSWGDAISPAARSLYAQLVQPAPPPFVASLPPPPPPPLPAPLALAATAAAAAAAAAAAPAAAAAVPAPPSDESLAALLHELSVLPTATLASAGATESCHAESGSDETGAVVGVDVASDGADEAEASLSTSHAAQPPRRSPMMQLHVQQAGRLEWHRELLPCILPVRLRESRAHCGAFGANPNPTPSPLMGRALGGSLLPPSRRSLDGCRSPPCLQVRLSVEHLWSGAAKTHIIERCCQLDLLQSMRPLSAWPGQGPAADYVVNLGPVTRAGAPNPALGAWQAEAQTNAEFDKLLQLRAALRRRGVDMLPTFDSLFMRLYAAKAFIPSHRDEGRRRLRIVGNMGRDRRVAFSLHAVSDTDTAVLEDAERLGLHLQHGWAYALSDHGAGRLPLRRDVTLSAELAPSLSSSLRSAEIDLFASHEVQPTHEEARLSMAWVVDLDERACGGHLPAIVTRYQESVLEVMLATGVSLDAALEPPRLPTPFLYRPFEAGRQGAKQAEDEDAAGAPPQVGPLAEVEQAIKTTLNAMEGAQERADEESAPKQRVDENTRFLMRVTCGSCGEQQWLPAVESATGALFLCFPPHMHAPSCPAAAATRTLVPSLRRIGDGYRLPVASDEGSHVRVELKVEGAAAPALAATTRVGLSIVKSTIKERYMFVTECTPLENARGDY